MQSSKTPSERAPSVRPDDGDSSMAASTTNAAAGDNDSGATTADATAANGSQLLPFPSGSELNGRLRRLIAAYQRENKKEELRLAAIDKRVERKERIEQVMTLKIFDILSTLLTLRNQQRTTKT
jgi:hypothetical protein